MVLDDHSNKNVIERTLEINCFYLFYEGFIDFIVIDDCKMKVILVIQNVQVFISFVSEHLYGTLVRIKVLVINLPDRNFFQIDFEGSLVLVELVCLQMVNFD